MTAYAINNRSTSEDDMMFLVTNLPCKPPKVEILQNVGTVQEAPEYMKSQQIVISTEATVNCSLTTHTKYVWIKNGERIGWIKPL